MRLGGRKLREWMPPALRRVAEDLLEEGFLVASTRFLDWVQRPALRRGAWAESA